MIFDKKNKLYKSPFSFGKGLLSDGKIISSAASGPPPLDPDAQAFITAASITDPTQISAINTLVVSLKGYGIWSKMKAIYPFVGGTASTHKWNLKDPRDLDAAFRLVFTGGWTHSSTGALPNGTNGYADTKLNTRTQTTFNSLHLSLYSRTNTVTGSKTEIGNIQPGFLPIVALSIKRTESAVNDRFVPLIYSFNAPDIINAANTDSRGFYLASRTAANSFKAFKNGLQQGSTVTTNGQTNSPNYPLFIGATNNSGSASGYSDREIAFSSIGDGLTDTEAANLYTAVQAYQTTLGRSIGTQTVSDPDAQAFVTAANIQDQVQADAVNNLTIGLKADGLWSKMKAIYPFVGGDATSHKFNLKDPRDLDAAFRLVFSGGVTHSNTGVLPNGTNGYANTFLNHNILNKDFNHVSYYSRTNNILNSREIAISNVNVTQIGLRYNATNGLYISTSTTDIIFNTSNSDYYGILSRTASNLTKYYKNGISINSNTTLSTNNPNGNFYLFARNKDNATVDFYSNRQCAFASIGNGLSDTEAANLYSRVQTYQTALNRQV